MMSESGNFLMAKPAVASLHRTESEVLAQALAGQAGAHGLHLSMREHPCVDWPRLGCLTRLRLVDDDQWHGDMRARVDEALPFADEAFRMIVLEHVLEWTPHAVNLLDETTRVLEADGYLAVTGFHPFSPWLPWLLCRRRPRPMLTAPGWVRQRLLMRGFDTLSIQRCGATFPIGKARSAAPWLGGGFVLVARKRRIAVMSLKPAHRARQKNTQRHGAWVPGTQRECA